MFDADIEEAVESDDPVELVISEFVDLLSPAGLTVGEAVCLFAGLAVVVFPDHDVEVLVVRIVERMVEEDLYPADGVHLEQVETHCERAHGGFHAVAHLWDAVVVGEIIVKALVVDHGVHQRRDAGGVADVMTDEERGGVTVVVDAESVDDGRMADHGVLLCGHFEQGVVDGAVFVAGMLIAIHLVELVPVLHGVRHAVEVGEMIGEAVSGDA